MGVMNRIFAKLGRFTPVGEGEAEVAAAPLVSLREAVRRFWPELRPYRGWLTLTLLFVAVGPLIGTATIWLYKRLVDEVLVPRDLGPLGPIALAYLALTLLGGVFSFGRDYLSAWVAERFLLGLRTHLFRHLHGLPLGFFERQRLGDVLSRLTDDVDEIEELLVGGVSEGLSHLLRIVFFTAALFYLDWRLAVVALVVAPPFWFAARRFANRIKGLAREQRRRDGAISAVAEESLANAPLVQAYNRQGTEVERFEREARGNFAAQLALERLRALFAPLIDLLELGGVLLVVAAGTWELSEGRLSLGGLLAFLAYLSQLYDPVRGLSRLVNDVFAASAGAERVIELLDEQALVVEPEHPVVLPRARGELVFDAVSFRYSEGAGTALDEVSFRLAPGETLALVGPSGAGKSTVVKLLLRFEDPAAGRVLLDGHDLRDLSLRSLRENVAVVLQETLLFDGTVRENIAYGRSGASEREIVEAAKAADAHGFIMALPEGYDTRVGQRGRSLSGGQRQRVAIARAMVRDAPLLILDEPTSGLDSAAAERILEPLRRLMSGRTTIIISHDLQTVREASQIVVLDGGRVVERGTHADLLDRGGLYARLARWQPVDTADEPSAAGGELLVVGER